MSLIHKIKVLQICVDLDGGGIDRYLYNYCSRIDDILFDFVVVDRGIVGQLEQYFVNKGCKIFRVPRQRGNILKNYFALKSVMNNGPYDAVHVHLGHMSFLALFCAKRCHIRTRIVHAHIAFVPETFCAKVKRKIFTILTKLYATNLAACGIDAGIWLWGQNAFEKGKVKVINNAIETNKYSYNPEIRKIVRDKMSVNSDTLVIGNVGRICPQKNQLRLIEIFAEYNSRHKNSQLWLIGGLEYDKHLWTSRCAELGVSQSIKLLGIRDDVPSLLQAMDVFVLPSEYEGLPFSLIETQCNGLPSITSTAVTRFVKISEMLEYVNLSSSNAAWCDAIEAASLKQHDISAYISVRESGYDVNLEAMTLRNYYIDNIMKNE